MLCADDTVTAAISCLDSFHYLGISGEILGMQADLLCTLGAIAAIGAVNWFGPRGMGRIALVVALITVVFTAIIAVCAIPSLHHTRVELPVHDSSLARAWSDAWIGFTEIVLALSGVEAIANMTGIMVSPVRVTVRRKHPDRHVCNPFVSRLLKCRWPGYPWKDECKVHGNRRYCLDLSGQVHDGRGTQWVPGHHSWFARRSSARLSGSGNRQGGQCQESKQVA